MFSTENSLFTAEQLSVVNAACAAMRRNVAMTQPTADEWPELEKAIADAVNNAWAEEMTEGQLTAAALRLFAGSRRD